MDDQNIDQAAPSPTEPQMPEATTPLASSSDSLSLQQIHETLSEFETQMKDTLTPENFERRLREKRRNLYSKYIEQELSQATSADNLKSALTHNVNLLDEASKNDVFRAIILEDVMKKASAMESDPIKSAEIQLSLVRDIYDAAEKVDPADGGVTPEWAVRKRREIRGGLARQIVMDDTNLNAVESYIAAFEQYEVNRLSTDEVWKTGDSELARHFRQVMRERERGELQKEVDEINADNPTETDQSAQEVSQSSQSEPEQTVVQEPQAPVAETVEPQVTPESTAPSQEKEEASEPEATPKPEVKRLDSSEIARTAREGARRRIRNISESPLSKFFADTVAGESFSGHAPRGATQVQSETPRVSDPEKFIIPETPVQEPVTTPSVTQEAAQTTHEEVSMPEVREPDTSTDTLPKAFATPSEVSEGPSLADEIEASLPEDVRREVIENLEEHEKSADTTIVTNQPLEDSSQIGVELNSETQPEPPKKKKWFGLF